MRYRSKPVEIEAWQWNGEDGMRWPQWLHNWRYNELVCYLLGDGLYIPTIEGLMKANKTDWIIRGTEGELYPCKDSVFQRKYEPVDALRGRMTRLDEIRERREQLIRMIRKGHNHKMGQTGMTETRCPACDAAKKLAKLEATYDAKR